MTSQYPLVNVSVSGDQLLGLHSQIASKVNLWKAGFQKGWEKATLTTQFILCQAMQIMAQLASDP